MPRPEPRCPPGQGRGGRACARIDDDCQTAICRREICCAGPCALCQSCRGPAGSCLNVPPARTTTREPPAVRTAGLRRRRQLPSTIAQACTRPPTAHRGSAATASAAIAPAAASARPAPGPFPGAVHGGSATATTIPDAPGEDAVCLGAGRCGAIDQRQLRCRRDRRRCSRQVHRADHRARANRPHGRCAPSRQLLGRGPAGGGRHRGRGRATGRSGAGQQLVAVRTTRPRPPGGGALGISLFPFDPPVPTTVGKPLAMVLSNSGGTCSVTMDGHVIPGDPYPAGAAFRRLPGEGWVQDIRRRLVRDRAGALTAGNRLLVSAARRELLGAEHLDPVGHQRGEMANVVGDHDPGLVVASRPRRCGHRRSGHRRRVRSERASRNRPSGPRAARPRPCAGGSPRPAAGLPGRG